MTLNYHVICLLFSAYCLLITRLRYWALNHFSVQKTGLRRASCLLLTPYCLLVV